MMQRWARYLAVLATCVALTSVLLLSCAAPEQYGGDSKEPAFQIRGSRFLLYGQPFRIVSCETYWKDRVLRSKALGCNTVQTYVPWNFHEPVPGVFDFDGQRNVTEFMALVQELGLYVLLRPGPYICAEWDLGGLPAWLLDPAITGNSLVRKLRTSEDSYIKYVDLWWGELLPKLRPLLVHNSGPVLMVQLENEYGVRVVGRDVAYLSVRPPVQHLRGLLLSALGQDTVLYTTDPPSVVLWGGLRDVFHAVDFGPKQWPALNFGIQYLMNWRSGKTAPFNSEFYTGWYTHWGSAVANTSTEAVAASLSSILAYGHNTGSVSLYMAHGGTSFGFWAGCNGEKFDVTSYDYNSPISESGNTGQPGVGGPDKFQVLQAIREQIALKTAEQLPEAPPEPQQAAYGCVLLVHEAPLLYNLAQLRTTDSPIRSKHPLPMEHYGLSFGMLAYTKHISCDLLQQKSGYLKFVAYDLTQVFADGVLIAQTWRAASDWHIPLTALSTFCSHPAHVPANSSAIGGGGGGVATVEVLLLVASYGRENFYTVGHSSQVQKGIVGDIVLHCGASGGAPSHNIALTHWEVHAMPLIQPGEVVKWPGGEARNTTRSLISSPERKPFDSMHGGVWRQAAHDEIHPSLFERATAAHDSGPGYHAQNSLSGLVAALCISGESRAGGERPHEEGGWGGVAWRRLKGGAALAGPARRLRASLAAEPPFSLHKMSQVHTFGHSRDTHESAVEGGTLEGAPPERLPHGPVFYRGVFEVGLQGSGLQDTFLSMAHFCRGMVWVNGHNLGRYWSPAGPQETLYVPKSFLLSGVNELVVLEMEELPEAKQAEFVAAPDFSG